MVSQYGFPPEIWTIVFQMISEDYHYDIKNVRLTCRIFEELATPFLLPRIICDPLSGSLTALTAVSRHPVLSRSVREVFYVCTRFQSIKTLPEYKEALRTAYPFGEFDEPKSEEENLGLNTAFSDYSRYYNNQAAMESSGEVIACLCSALMRMPNIERITISPNFEYELYDVLDDGLDSEMDDELDTYHYPKYFLEPYPAYNEAFLLMAHVLSLTGANIRELGIEGDDDDCGHGVDGALFRGMSHLNLSHCYLERLRIHCIDGMFHISTRYILGTKVWSRLTSLDFYSTTFDQGDFLDVLRRHSGTLKDINLFCVHLTNGSWKTLLAGMKSSLSLQHISIEDPYEEDSNEEIYLNVDALRNYLFGDGPNPLSIEYLLNLQEESVL
ncbi:hypothetical protein DL98DRAFT_522696 [Cadophora sp. DSE1049]|nr:hypothetical protein DL98DRAFT_522696 [Cadophora sp. DSE1049]